jgi:hypothetical protein
MRGGSSRGRRVVADKLRNIGSTKVRRCRGWTGQDFYSPPEVWASSRET